MTANPVRPSRHRAGKPAGAESSESDSSDSEAPPPEPKKRTAPPRPPATGAGKVISTGLAGAQRQQADKEEAARKAKARAELERKAAEEGFVTESEGEGSGSEEEDEGSEEESSEEESSSEDEAPRLMIKPKFISRAQRQAGAAGPSTEREAEAEAEAEAERQKKAATDALVEEQIRKDIAARAAGRKHWEDDDDEAGADEVDTEDDADSAAEHAAWKLRELKRVRRDRERIEARERELAEVERRRGLTEEERAAEDAAHLARQKEERDGRGKMAYMQKYFHRGAFFQDDAAAEGVAGRDLMGARFADDVRNRELLPQALQMRDMARLGRKGASKYKDLRSEDTGRWGAFEDTRPGKGGFDRHGDERFQPDRDGRDGAAREGGQGANSIPLGRRKDLLHSTVGKPVDRSGYDDMDRPRAAGQERPRSRSRSRSPRRDRDGDRDGYRDRRKRSSSRDGDAHNGDKRRRIDAGY